MRVSNVNVTIVDVPQVAPIAPYRSHVRTSSTTRSAIVQVESDEGLTGWGEHNVNFLEGVSGGQMQHAARDWLLGRDPCTTNKLNAPVSQLPSRRVLFRACLGK